MRSNCRPKKSSERQAAEPRVKRSLKALSSARNAAGRSGLCNNCTPALRELESILGTNFNHLCNIANVLSRLGYRLVTPFFAYSITQSCVRLLLTREPRSMLVILMAGRRQRPKKVIVHSDRGSQYASDDRQRFCGTNGVDSQHEPPRGDRGIHRVVLQFNPTAQPPGRRQSGNFRVTGSRR